MASITSTSPCAAAEEDSMSSDRAAVARSIAPIARENTILPNLLSRHGAIATALFASAHEWATAMAEPVRDSAVYCRREQDFVRWG